MSERLAIIAQYDWATWFIGIMRAFIVGGAGALAAPAGPMFMDAKDYNLAEGLHKVLASMAIAFIITGIAMMGVFLKTHGAPDKLQKDLAAAAASSAATTAAIGQAVASNEAQKDSGK